MLPALEALRFAKERVRTARDNKVFLAANPGFVAPPLWWMHDMYAHTSLRQYWETGQRDAARLEALMAQYLARPPEKILEWGCGLGRILRHFSDGKELTGVDYNAAAINWARAHLPGITFAVNQPLPPLDLPADSIDAAYAISVFTHLSKEAHGAWMAEIMRVLRPGGIFLFTVHGAPAPGQLLPAEQAVFDRGELVTRGVVKEGSRIYTAYQPEKYMRDILLAELDILAGPVADFGQTLWIVRKPS